MRAVSAPTHPLTPADLQQQLLAFLHTQHGQLVNPRWEPVAQLAPVMVVADLDWVQWAAHHPPAQELDAGEPGAVALAVQRLSLLVFGQAALPTDVPAAAPPLADALHPLLVAAWDWYLATDSR